MPTSAPELIIIAAVDGWLADGLSVALATVVETRWSTPRPVGAKLAICETGAVAGAISGGCVDADVCAVASEVLRTGHPRVMTYGDVGDEELEVGLPCGG